MTPLSSALRACCRGDWSKGVDERASTITLFSPPTLSPPAPSLCPATYLCSSPGSLASIHSNICHPFVTSHSGGKKCRMHEEHILPLLLKPMISRFLLRVLTTQYQWKWGENAQKDISYVSRARLNQQRLRFCRFIMCFVCILIIWPSEASRYHNLLNTFVLLHCLCVFIASAAAQLVFCCRHWYIL